MQQLAAEWQIIECPNCETPVKCDSQHQDMFLCPVCAVPFTSPANHLRNPVPDDPVEEVPTSEDSDEAWLDTPQWRPDETAGPIDIRPIQHGQTQSEIRPEPEKKGLDFSRIRHSYQAGTSTPMVRVSPRQNHLVNQLTSWDETGPATTEETDLDSATANPARMAVIVAAIVVLMLVAGVGVAMLAPAENPDEDAASTAREVALAKYTPIESATMSRTLSAEMTADVLAVTEKFLNAESVAEQAQFVRQAERVEPIMRQFYGSESLQPIAYRPFAADTRIGVANSMLLLSVEYADHSTHPIALELMENGEFRVDWESFVGHSEIPWRDISAWHPSFSFFVRARVLQSDYFNYGFKEGWTCWQLEDASGEHRLFGYVPLGSPLDQRLKKELGSQKSPLRMMLRLRYPDGPPHAENQLEITEIVARGWVLDGT